MTISPISLPAISTTAPISTPIKPSGEAQKLEDTFANILDGLNQSQQNADDLSAQLAAGGNVDLHQVMIATEENDVNFRVALAMRDRLVDAYHEVMRMSV